jgi:hypothetical protein
VFEAFAAPLPCEGYPCKNSVNTTPLIVVMLLSSYEESANMSRCMINRLKSPVKGDEMLSRPQVHEFSGYGVCRDELSTL